MASCCACSPGTRSSTWSPPPRTARPGSRVDAVHPQLTGLDLVLGATDPATLADADLVFLALPHGAVGGARRRSCRPRSRIVDLGADHRLRRRRTPGRSTTAARTPGTWTYGLPELPGQRAADRRLRPGWPNTGCYAAAITLALAPLIAAGAASPADVVVVAASGTSGAGRAAKPHLLASEVMGDLSPYKVGRPPARPGDQAGHRRDRRCRSPRSWRRCRAASWPPSPRVPARRRRPAARCWRAAYADAPFVHVLPEGALAAHRRHPGLQLLPPAGHRRRRLGPADRASARSTTSARAPPVRPCSAPT